LCEDPAHHDVSDTPLFADELNSSPGSDDPQVGETTSLAELSQREESNGAQQPVVSGPTSCHAKTFLEIAYGDFCAVRTGYRESDDDDEDRDREVSSVTRRIVCVEKTASYHHTSVPPPSAVAVQLFNSSQLLSHLGSRANSSIFGRCTIVLFYAPWCTFCVRLAPHYNALARAFPTLDVVAIDAYHFSR